MLVAAETSDGQQHSIILQNAETVKIVGPAPEKVSVEYDGASATELFGEGKEEVGPMWRTIAVTEIELGCSLYVKRSDAGVGRHMGIAVQEMLNEW